MEHIEVSSWVELREKIQEIVKSYTWSDNTKTDIPPDVYYRGQADAGWRLETTLERYDPSGNWTLTKYLALALRCAPRIESFTDKSWHLPNSKGIEKKLRIHHASQISTIIPCLEFLAYLRHHGFPSPILDWVRSPYIAAFFAFGEQNKAEKAAVFAYIEIPRTVKDINVGGPNIEVLDSKTLKTHKRHFLQQSVYTVCAENKGFDREFVSHEQIFEWGDGQQDLLIKIVMPRKERIKILDDLNKMNINHFSLFQSEESLMKTLAFEEIELPR